MRNSTLFSFAALSLAASLVAGCGGSSGGGGGSAPGKVAVYVTDSLGSNDHVWVTIHKIVVNSDSASQTVYDDAAGKVVDLASLRDSRGSKYNFFALSGLKSGSYKSASVTMAKALTLVPKGSLTGTSREFADQFDDGAGKSKVTFGFKNPRLLGQSDPTLAIDFDLQNWNLVGGKVVPLIKESDGSGLGQEDRHQHDDYHGKVSALTGTAPDQQFTLNGPNGSSITVTTDSKTVVYRRNGDPNPTLAISQNVEVRGAFMSTTGVLKADSIKIEGGTSSSDEVRGAPGAVNAGAGTFDVTVSGCHGFLPSGKVVHVVTTDATKFRASHGVTLTKDEFYAALATATNVEVEGAYDDATQTITASHAKIEDSDDGSGGGGGGGGHHEAEAKGSSSAIDAVAGSFTLTLSEWEGFTSQVGSTVSVTTSGTTQFFDKRKNPITKDAFFTQLAVLGHAEVKGDYSSGTIAAVRCKLED